MEGKMANSMEKHHDKLEQSVNLSAHPVLFRAARYTQRKRRNILIIYRVSSMVSAVLVLAVLAVLAACQPGATNQDNPKLIGSVSIESVEKTPIKGEDRNRADEANIGRWTAMGNHYSKADEHVQSLGSNADQARWDALGSFYGDLAGGRSNNSIAADQSRWDAKGIVFAEMDSDRLEKGNAAAQARWETLGSAYSGYYLTTTNDADQSRWDAMGEAYLRLAGELLGSD